MIDQELANRLDLIMRRFLELKKIALELQAQINALAAALSAIPPFQAQFASLLSDEQIKIADQVREVELELRALGQGASRHPSQRPN